MRQTILGAVAAAIEVAAFGLIRYGTRTLAWAVGGVLLGAALPLMVLARRQLGRAFAVTPQAKGLVTHGLYSRIPHPMYLFLDLALLGGILLLRQPALLLILAALAVVQAWQATREAKVLEAAFGEQYRSYRAHTWW